MKPKYDMLWKGMLEEIMEDLLIFVDPSIGKDLDLQKGFQFLDKELDAFHPEPNVPSNTKVVDKLVKVFLRGGGEQWMLLHIEVQGSHDHSFPIRMFEYLNRIYTKHNRPIAGLTILTRPKAPTTPANFQAQWLWTQVYYDYKNICIADYPDEVLAASNNPFAMVMMVAKHALLKPKSADEENDKELLARKILIAKLLKEKMLIIGEKKTAAILTFLNNYTPFKKSETIRKFTSQTNQIFKKKNPMGIIEQWAEIRHQEGLEEGKELAVRILLENTQLSQAQIAEKVGVPLSLVKKIKKQLK